MVYIYERLSFRFLCLPFLLYNRYPFISPQHCSSLQSFKSTYDRAAFRMDSGWLVNSFHEEKIWKIIWIPPALFVFFSQYLVPENSDKIYVDKTLEIYLLAIAMSVSLIIIVYLLFFQIAHIVIEKQNVTEKNLYLQIEAEQTRKLQAFINDTSRLRHDYRHHLATLNQMLEENKYAEAKEYLKEFSSAISTM